MRKNRPLIIFGTSGAAQEIYYMIKQYNNSSQSIFYQILGFIAEKKEMIGSIICDETRVIATDSDISILLQKHEEIYGVIQFGNPKLKAKIIDKMKIYSNLSYPNIIHPSVIYNKEAVSMGKGNIVAAGTVIASKALMGDFNLINRSCTIGHDFELGNKNTINPGSVVSGNVNIGNGCLIGAGSIILEELELCDNIVIGAGAVLTKNVTDEGVWVGVPARLM